MLIDLDDLATTRMTDDEPLVSGKTALIIVDMMNLFCDATWLASHEDDPEKRTWFATQLDAVTPRIAHMLDAFRKANALVVHVINAKWTHDGREVVLYQRGRDYDIFGSDRMSVIAPLTPRPGEILIHKVASSSFTGTGLDFMLRNAGISNVVLSGQYGDCCVFYTLIQSREYGYTNYWVEDALLYSSDTHKALISAFVGSRLAKLAKTKDVVRALGVPTSDREGPSSRAISN